ncbi:IS110 family transposase [Paracoccus binzhouensis]|uniref:IS110 family transposase n=1 Tax=Paracoccus binzhouensis TaxID=2796149 RepID=UPI0038CDA262
MIPAVAVIGIDVSRDWLDGFCASSGRHLRLPNTVAGHAQLLVQLRALPQPVRVGFEATGGQEWVLWATLVAAGVEAVQLPPAQIKAFALSLGTHAKTVDRRGIRGLTQSWCISGFMLAR